MPSHLLSLLLRHSERPRQGEGQRDGRRSITLQNRPLVACRYRGHIVKADQLSALPSPIRAAYNAAEGRFLGSSRGLVRDKNDRAVDSKARHFATWLATSGYDDLSLANMEEGHVIPTVVAYLHHLAYQQGSMKKQASLSPASLVGYLNAALEWIRSELGLQAIIINSAGARHKMIQDILDQARNWQKPKAKREPYTAHMICCLSEKVEKAAKIDPDHRLGKEVAVLDWARLSAFTGSRVGKYAQSVGTSKKASRVPKLPFAEEWGGGHSHCIHRE